MCLGGVVSGILMISQYSLLLLTVATAITTIAHSYRGICNRNASIFRAEKYCRFHRAIIIFVWLTYAHLLGVLLGDASLSSSKSEAMQIR